MNRRAVIASVLFFLVLAAGIVFFSGQTGCVQDPSVRETSRRIRCDGSFEVHLGVTNNLSLREPYTFVASAHPNFLPNPPVANPRQKSIDPAATEYVVISGKLIQPCEPANTTVAIRAVRQTGATNDYDFTIGPLEADGVVPDEVFGNPNFSYEIEVACCADTATGIFRFRDTGSIRIDGLTFAPDLLDCSGAGLLDVTVSGALRHGADSGIVVLGLRKDGSSEGCRFTTDISRHRIENPGE